MNEREFEQRQGESQAHGKESRPQPNAVQGAREAARVPLHKKISSVREFGRGQIRAIGEDDDGYDPYSDRVEYRPLFERDPWD